MPSNGAIDGLLAATRAVVILTLGATITTPVMIMTVMVLKRLTLPLTETMIFLL
jgi:hypothetical protein